MIRFRHKFLDLDLKELQPSEIVKSVMAKRSVFDEDSKRLENVGEKYEPRDFNLFPRSVTAVQTTVPATPLSAPQPLKVSSTVQLPKTPTMLSPRSTGKIFRILYLFINSQGKSNIKRHVHLTCMLHV